MLILTIDSSTKVGSVSLINDDKLVGERLLNLKLNHAPRLMPEIISIVDKCGFSREDLTGIGVTVGPGSFTGTRIGVATAKTLAQSLDIPIVGVSTLKGLASSLKYVTGYICPMIDARRNRVFTALYQGTGSIEEQFVSQTEESLIDIDDLLEELAEIKEPIYFVGQIVAEHRSKIEAAIEDARFVERSYQVPRAGNLADLALAKLVEGKEDELFELTPNYLRRSQAEIQWAANN
jgi:tRNA threonylcarbamoyladenosine biosynthesis protein TsaB